MVYWKKFCDERRCAMEYNGYLLSGGIPAAQIQHGQIIPLYRPRMPLYFKTYTGAAGLSPRNLRRIGGSAGLCGLPGSAGTGHGDQLDAEYSHPRELPDS